MLVDFIDSPAEAAFRAEVRRWLAVTLRELPRPESLGWTARRAHFQAWQRAVRDGGYAGLAWPVAYGGRGATVAEQAIWVEEINRAGAPDPLNGIGEKLAGPTIIEFGTETQKLRFLPAILAGDELWCQLFSEPGAGSDLAGLQSKAVRCAGGWQVRGQKVWTSRAHIADYAILLARTGEEPRHAGLTFFLMPMRQPGVTVVPLRQMTGDSEFNEVFLDDAFVPEDHVMVAPGEGWRVARATLQYERAFVAMGRVDFGRWLEDLLEDVRATFALDGSAAGADPVLRQQIARLYEKTLVQRVVAQQVLRRIDRGEEPGAESSVGKLTLSPLIFELADLGVSIAGLDGIGDPMAESGGSGAKWQQRAQFARGITIAGGTPQIQKNIVAERVLGLPRG